MAEAQSAAPGIGSDLAMSSSAWISDGSTRNLVQRLATFDVCRVLRLEPVARMPKELAGPWPPTSTERPIPRLPTAIDGCGEILPSAPASLDEVVNIAVDLPSAVLLIRALIDERRRIVDTSSLAYREYVRLERLLDDIVVATDGAWTKTAYAMIDTLWHVHDAAHGWFRYPVSDVVAINYSKVVPPAKQMSLSDMYRLLRNGHWTSSDAVLRDLAALLNASQMYNGDSPITDAARRVKVAGQRLLRGRGVSDDDFAPPSMFQTPPAVVPTWPDSDAVGRLRLTLRLNSSTRANGGEAKSVLPSTGATDCTAATETGSSRALTRRKVAALEEKPSVVVSSDDDAPTTRQRTRKQPSPPAVARTRGAQQRVKSLSTLSSAEGAPSDGDAMRQLAALKAQVADIEKKLLQGTVRSGTSDDTAAVSAPRAAGVVTRARASASKTAVAAAKSVADAVVPLVINEKLKAKLDLRKPLSPAVNDGGTVAARAAGRRRPAHQVAQVSGESSVASSSSSSSSSSSTSDSDSSSSSGASKKPRRGVKAKPVGIAQRAKRDAATAKVRALAKAVDDENAKSKPSSRGVQHSVKSTKEGTLLAAIPATAPVKRRLSLPEQSKLLEMLDEQVSAFEVRYKELHGRAIVSDSPGMYAGDPKLTAMLEELLALRASVVSVVSGTPLES